MKIAILSCFYPYRGGIAQFNANIFVELGKYHTVRAFNFKRQYPSLLFPGKTQYVSDKDDAINIESIRVLDSINPLSYISTTKAINNWAPDLLIIRYWTSFLAPALGYVSRNINSNIKVISILDNVIPHERRFFDTLFTKYFLKGSDRFIVLSEAVGKDLNKILPNASYKTIPHPIYNHFGDKIAPLEAQERLSLIPNKRNLLFFGIIREYKGLDILIEAFGMLDERYQLIIAGEPYGSFDKYKEQIENSPAKDRIKLFTRYIDDSEVPLFFSASEITILPYRTATQSGISAIAYHFDLPLITTNVGGLEEAVGQTGTGIVVDRAEPALIANAVEKYFNDGNREEYIANIKKIKEELSWEMFSKKLIEYYNSI